MSPSRCQPHASGRVAVACNAMTLAPPVNNLLKTYLQFKLKDFRRWDEETKKKTHFPRLLVTGRPPPSVGNAFEAGDVDLPGRVIAEALECDYDVWVQLLLSFRSYCDS